YTKTAKVFDRADIILLINAGGAFDKYETKILNEAKKRNTPVINVVNTYLSKPKQSEREVSSATKCCQAMLVFDNDMSKRDVFLEKLKKLIAQVAPQELLNGDNFFSSYLKRGDTVVLVTPIDSGAPKGRLIMPQVQTIRMLLDADINVLVVKESGYGAALKKLKFQPQLVICDSQVIKLVAKLTPKQVKLTSFSILFAAQKADISVLAEGVAQISKLKNGDKVLIVEACAHHAGKEDIGRVKLPDWLKHHTGKNLSINFSNSEIKNIKNYKLIIHCGACVLNKKDMTQRLNTAKTLNVPITNYGMAIAFFSGAFERALSLFPQGLKAYRKALK
ncbi:MAG: [FeFe] hydrogenase H-cluster maturation GTPase HydF, partial [Elusimicrobia bacterium]|nr:[FeFe] hydrogenase H-cluster maturation GTPase HydF [Elusimicrobiota bacterium]